MKQPAYVFSIINYPNGDVFLILINQAGLLTTSKSEQNYCCAVFILHVSVSPQAGVNPESFVIKQSRRSHNMMRFAASSVVFSCLTSPSPIFQVFDSWRSVSRTKQSYTPRVWMYFTFKFDKRIHRTLHRFYVLKKKLYPSPNPTNWFWTFLQRIVSLDRCF